MAQGANLLTVRRDTGGDYRIFTINSGKTVTISGLTISNGNITSGDVIGNSGGGILNRGTLTVNNCTISGNSAIKGGGIASISDDSGVTATLNINNCTISGNSASVDGGGIEQVIVHCHAITADGQPCPTGATQFCEALPINATSSPQALDACRACFGAANCTQATFVGGAQAWNGSVPAVNDTFFTYSSGSGPGACGHTPLAGEINSGAGCLVSRWAP
jgi:hypothetical protein